MHLRMSKVPQCVRSQDSEPCGAPLTDEKVAASLHSVLKPFLLRRVKNEVLPR